MSAHTAGTWSARNQGDGATGEVRDANGLWVARVHQRNGDAMGAECVANTRLIAAAPTMLDGLKIAVARLARVDGGDTMVVSTLLDVIYDATGEEFDVQAFLSDEDARAEGKP